MEKKYAAFLSYSHASDVDLSGAVRDALQGLARPWYRPRALRVFRDNSSLAANEALWPSIQAALDASRFFILLASPHAVTSRWVGREVEYWLERNPPGTLLIAVTAGELRWDAGRGDFDRAATTCVPEALYGRFREEPRWVDLRGLPADRLTLRDLRFRDRVADLAAPLHGLGKDDLVGADIRHYRRARRLVRATIATLTALTVVIAASALVAMDRARVATEQRIVADERGAFADEQSQLAEQRRRDALARRLMAEADLLTGTGEHPEAARLGLAALHLRDDPENRARLLGYTARSDIEATVTGHTGAVRGLAHSPDGTTLATASADHTTMLWDVRDPYRPRRLGDPLTGHTGIVYDVQFSPDGRLLATAGLDGQVILWDVRDVSRPEPIGDPLGGHTGGVSAAVFSPDRPLLATAGLDGQVILWDITDPGAPTPIGEPIAQADQVWTAAFSPDGRLLATGGRAGSLLVWDVDGPAPALMAERVSPGSGGIRSLAFHPDGDLVATGGFDDSVDIWNVTDATATDPVASHPYRHAVFSVAFSLDGRNLAVGGPSPEIRILAFDPADSFPLSFDDSRAEAFDSAVVRLRYSPDGQVLAVGSDNGQLSLRDAGRDYYPSVLETDLGGGRAVLSANGNTLLVFDLDTVTLWDVSDRRRPTRLGEPQRVHSAGVAGAAFSPDGRLIATTGLTQTPEGFLDEVRLWDVSDPASIVAVGDPVHAGDVESMAFSAGGNTLATASLDRGLILWDLSDPDEIVAIRRLGEPGEGAHAVAFSPDGRTVAMGSAFARTVLWDVTDPARPGIVGEPLTEQTSSVTAVAFSADGALLATGSADGSIILWDATERTRPKLVARPLVPGPALLRSVAFSPDGRTLAAVEVGEMHLWDISHPPYPVRVASFDAETSTVTFSPDGRTLLLGGNPFGQADLWDYSILDEIRQNLTTYACAVAGRGLDVREWESALPAVPHHDTCPTTAS